MNDLLTTPTTQASLLSENAADASPLGSSSAAGLRKERGAIAAQPTKKDKTLVEILDRIKNLECKIDNLAQRPSAPPAYSGGDNGYQYVSSVHQMLKWPAIQQLFASIQPKLPHIDLSSLEREGPASMLALRRSTTQSLPPDIRPSVGRGSGASLHELVTTQASITVADLNWDTMQRLSKGYFDSLNLLCPILNRHSFMSETLPRLFNNGLSHSMESTIAILVFALGEVAIAGTEGLPVHASNGRPSGIKGGTKDRPPGLDLFNEARRRMGFNLTECSLENVQIFALSSGLNLELGFPLTGLERMESVVGLPDFSSPFLQEDYISNQESHFQEHFASQIVLRRLLVDFHHVLSQGGASSSSLGPIHNPHLPNRCHLHRPPTTSTTNTTTPTAPSLMFTTDLDLPPVRYPYVFDVQAALLRSRYYYTKYLIHRPFLYKALHIPPDAVLSHDDALGVAECLKACLKWPVAMSPVSRHKRLVPCGFFFTQNFFGILVVLHLSETVPILRRIRRSRLCGERFEMDAMETVGLYLDWLRDLKNVDAGTEWHWEVVRAVYGLEE
ncbi:hypothetical protein N0V88_006614 [Collariella sp. IMI 366227]|nr:hypothetical protein N0V88_006614 [Collariella sp. IMI 366227]